jgi:phosphoadenosine phosphosulfate reductase
MGAIALYAGQKSQDFTGKLERTRELLVRAASQFQPLKQASSLGAEDMVISHLIASLGLPIPIFVLDTGMLHGETAALLARLRGDPALQVEVHEPQQEQVVEFVRLHGDGAMYRSLELRKSCCALRKMVPLKKALAGHRAWITGLRREQSANRAEVPLEDASEALLKFNPLAEWSWGDVWHYIAQHGVDYNPLHDAFYPSIGCAPCTRAIAVGEDFRSGRWWWEESAKECGLHVKQEQEQAA